MRRGGAAVQPVWTNRTVAGGMCDPWEDWAPMAPRCWGSPLNSVPGPLGVFEARRSCNAVDFQAQAGSCGRVGGSPRDTLAEPGSHRGTKMASPRAPFPPLQPCALWAAGLTTHRPACQ